MASPILSTPKIEMAMYGGMALGVSFALVHKAFGPWAHGQGGRIAKVFVELQRKSFHMIGGCIICMFYHFGIKHGYITPAFGATSVPQAGSMFPMEGGTAILSVCFSSWMLEASRLSIPAIQNWYLRSFRGLIREKEVNKGAGIAFFIPGALAAFLAGPPNLGILGVLFLSIGDAAASLGTAAGVIPVGTSPRKVEGSIGCMVVCTAIGTFVGLTPQVAAITAAIVSFGEVLAEIIGLDDNLVIPMLGVLGVRIASAPQFAAIGLMGGAGLSVGIILGMVVSATTSSRQKVHM